MEWWQWLLVYALGLMLTKFLRELVLTKPISVGVDDWEFFNVLAALLWPIYLPFLIPTAMVKALKDELGKD